MPQKGRPTRIGIRIHGADDTVVDSNHVRGDFDEGISVMNAKGTRLHRNVVDLVAISEQLGLPPQTPPELLDDLLTRLRALETKDEPSVRSITLGSKLAQWLKASGDVARLISAIPAIVDLITRASP